MMKPDQIEKELEAARITDWDEKRLKEVGKLPSNLARIGRFLLHRDPVTAKPMNDWTKRHEHRKKMPGELTALRPAERTRLFLTIFPHLGETITAALELCTRLPYEIDYEREGFRAPGDEKIATEARWEWLENIVTVLNNLDPSPAWLAAWAPFVSGGSGADTIGILLAASIDLGGPQGDEVYQILLDTINRAHPVGQMGRHVTRGLMVASKPGGWEAIEKLLLATQRQEGLRQVILETVDEAHPEAFKRMLRLVRDHDLLRFSAAVRAAMVWFGMADSEDETVGRFKKVIATVLGYFDDPEACRKAIEKSDGDELYLALWVVAYEDARNAVPLAAGLLKDRKVERRYLAVRFLDAVRLPAAQSALVPAMEDEDLRVALRAFQGLQFDDDGELEQRFFEPLQRLLARMPEKTTTLKPIGHNDEIEADPGDIAASLIAALGDRNVEILLPYLPKMCSHSRAHLAGLLAKAKPLTTAGREAIFGMLGDRDSYVRSNVLDEIKKLTLTADESILVEGLLTRKGADVREQVLKLLSKQKADGATASADRLLESKNANQRVGGLELLRQMVGSKKAVAACREKAQAYVAGHPKIGEHEQAQLDAILDVQREKHTLENALGLLDRSQLSPIVAPVQRPLQLITPAARAILSELDKWVTANAEVMVHLAPTAILDDDDDDDDDFDDDGDGLRTDPRQMPLGSITYELPDPEWNLERDTDLARMPLREELTKWWNDRAANLRDADGLELVRARCLGAMNDYLFSHSGINKKSQPQVKAMKAILGGQEKPVKLKNDDSLLMGLLDWLCRLTEPAATDFLLAATENSFAQIPDEVLHPKKRKTSYYDDWRSWNVYKFWFGEMERLHNDAGSRWTPEQQGRRFQILRWLERPTPKSPRRPLDWDDLVIGYELGLANLSDLTEQFLGPRGERGEDDDDFDVGGFDVLKEVTRRPEPELFSRRPEVRDLVERCRRRILEVELARGDLPTAASGPAQALNSVIGLDLLGRLLTVLGRPGLRRNHWGLGRAQTFSRLVQHCYPGPEDTPERFAEQMRELVKAKSIAPGMPLLLAFFNSRWVDHVAHYLKVPELAEAVWWFFAHMAHSSPEISEVLEANLLRGRPAGGEQPNPWELLVRERTTLSEEDRDEGAVDSGWFHRVYELIGPKFWKEVSEASKFADNGNGYRHAVRLSDVLLGKAKKTAIIREVRQRKLKESVRLLGLLPLAKAEKREADLQHRWKALSEYRKYARGLSPLSREDAIRTGEIGLANLARTAGFADPNRLIWAMEWNEIQDLAAGPVVATAGDVTVTLTLDDQAQPITTVNRGEKVLKAIPPKARKDKKIAALVERRAALRQQASRIRIALEAMLVRGDIIRGEELPSLMKHPLVARNLSRLMLVGEGIRGYPVHEGKGLEDYAGKVEPVKKDEVLRLAHPLDLLEGKDWHEWQAHCFKIERVQPFKQVFRELYLLTDAERAERLFSRRYSGQQVNPNQAMALFGSRGWRTRDGVEKTFPAENLVAEVGFQYGGGTPLEVEGLTLDRLRFHRRAEWESMPISEVPARIFSEVMRDLDLVVSVAHVGGVDPEASASTVEMRASLATEMCSLLNLKNAKVTMPHLIIDGHLAKYSLHLGSGTVHKMPGGSLCIVSVPAQHRGRIFLPFADDDPRTAEVIAKLLLLARDDEIQDPNILDQLRR